MEFCTEPNVLRVFKMFDTLLTIAAIIIPIIIISVTSKDIIQAIASEGIEEVKKMGVQFGIRIFWGLLIVFLPSMVTAFMTSVADVASISRTEYQDCITNMENIAYYDQLAQMRKEQELAELRAQEEEVKKAAETRIQEAKARYQENKKNNPTSGSGASSDGTFMGQKFQLTEAQLRGIANVCQREQGTAEGAAAEASLMANRFELYGSKYGSGGSGLFNYVANCRWWGTSSTIYNTSSVREDVVAAVKEVLVMGNRTLPLYVDEHDCIDCGSYGFDITKIVNDGQTITSHSALKDHSNYTQDKTILYNRYGAVYTFYTFPTPTSDPFGYTSTALNKYNAMNNGS